MRASVRIFLETDADGAFRRRVGTAVAPAVPAWIERALQAHTTFLREHRGLAVRTVHKRAWQLARMADFWDRTGVATLSDLRASHIQQFFERDDLLDILEHPNPERYGGQRIFVVRRDNYVYLVPFVEDEHTVFLKTIVPSRKATKEYLGEESDHED